MDAPARPAAPVVPMAGTVQGRPLDHCAIDFGTSNSAIAIPDLTAPSGADGAAAPLRLVPLEDGQLTLPTAVFYLAEGLDLPNLPRRFGRAAVAAYVEGLEGRLMRSMKSALGSSLMDQRTDIGAGRAVSFAEVITGYLLHLKRGAEAATGAPLKRVVLGRPVFFVDDDAVRDQRAQDALEAAARAVGFEDVHFQYEPIAAALHFEQQAEHEQVVLVADIGGGTSDFSLVRVGPERRGRLERRDDILANHGVHVAGTDFDRRVAIAGPMRDLGCGSHGPSIAGAPAREVPSRIYHDLATWHLINQQYTPQRLAEAKALKVNYADPRHHQRLMTVLLDRLGHELAGRAEDAKIAVSAGADTVIDLGHVERHLRRDFSAAEAAEALIGDVERIVQTALETVRRAGLGPERVDAVYFTGGSTGLRFLVDRLAAAFPAAQAVHGDRLASVATGLGVYAGRLFGA